MIEKQIYVMFPQKNVAHPEVLGICVMKSMA